MKIDAVILSAGSEIVALAIFEELTMSQQNVAVIALRKQSLLEAACAAERFCYLPWPPLLAEASAQAILAQLQLWGATPQDPVLLFATEDGSLRLLLDYQHLFSPLAYFSHAKHLPMAGLDKAEFFQYLQGSQFAHCVAKTQVIRQPAEVVAALQLLGPAVIKPALKPLSMELTGMSSKAFRSRDFASNKALLTTLTQSWGLSEHWLVQQELQQSAQADIAVYAVRGTDFYYAMVAEVLCRHPAHTGTGCWVRVLNNPTHPALKHSSEILQAIDFHGICEIEFMQDQQNQFKVVELNPRPWLQTGLTTAAGVHLLTACSQILRGKNVTPLPPAAAVAWVCPERLVQRFISTMQLKQPNDVHNDRWHALKQLVAAFSTAQTFSVYSSRLPGVKRRWLQRILRELWSGKQQH